MQGTQSGPCGTITATADPAGHVRLLPAPPRVGRGDEALQIRPPGVQPPQAMTGTKSITRTSRTSATADMAKTGTENRIVGSEDQGVGAELPGHDAHKALHDEVLVRYPGCQARDITAKVASADRCRPSAGGCGG